MVEVRVIGYNREDVERIAKYLMDGCGLDRSTVVPLDPYSDSTTWQVEGSRGAVTMFIGIFGPKGHGAFWDPENLDEALIDAGLIPFKVTS